MDQQAIDLDFGLSDVLEELRQCGLNNRCIDILGTRDPDQDVRQIARQFRRKVLSQRQFGRRGPQILRAGRAWYKGRLPRKSARRYLSRYLEPFLDADDYTRFLTDLSLGQATFDLRAKQIVRLDAVDTQELVLNTDLPFLLEEDGRAIKQARLALANLGPGSGILAQVGRSFVAEPKERFLIELVPFVQYELFTLDLMLFALSPADTRRDVRGAVAEAVAQTYGNMALAAVPVEIMYDAVHGAAVVEEVIPKLERTAKQMQQHNADMIGVLEPVLGRDVAGVLRNLWKRMDVKRAAATARVMKKANARSAERSLITAGRLPAQATVSTNLSADLVVTPRVVVNNAPQNNEIYWINTDAWPYLQAALLLMSQSGVRCYLTAASNRWGGRHPPHMTHRSGKEIDLDWRFDLTNAAIVPNLPQGKKVLTPDGNFLDPKKGKFDHRFRDNAGPQTHVGTDALASWIVYQSLVLTGFTHLLYSDGKGLSDALDGHLAKVLPHLDIPKTWPLKETGPTMRPPSDRLALVEPEVHYNHLHAEWRSKFKPDGTSALKLDDWDMDTLVTAARQRDQDPVFYETFFQDENGVRDERGAESWLAYSTYDTPSLLPAWHIPPEAQPEFVAADPVGTAYDTLDEALLNAAVYLNHLSGLEKVEHATTIYRNTAGKYAYVAPEKGDLTGSEPPKLSANKYKWGTTWVADLDVVVANLHTHVGISAFPSETDFNEAYREREENGGPPPLGLSFLAINTGPVWWFDSDGSEIDQGDDKLVLDDAEQALHAFRGGNTQIISMAALEAKSAAITKRVQQKLKD